MVRFDRFIVEVFRAQERKKKFFASPFGVREEVKGSDASRLDGSRIFAV